MEQKLFNVIKMTGMAEDKGRERVFFLKKDENIWIYNHIQSCAKERQNLKRHMSI